MLRFPNFLSTLNFDCFSYIFKKVSKLSFTWLTQLVIRCYAASFPVLVEAHYREVWFERNPFFEIFIKNSDLILNLTLRLQNRTLNVRFQAFELKKRNLSIDQSFRIANLYVKFFKTIRNKKGAFWLLLLYIVCVSKEYCIACDDISLLTRHHQAMSQWHLDTFYVHHQTLSPFAAH